ncbi:MAG TPA: hypoxanthine phosphoribosyltransferase [Chitinophagaceae bacterium]|jgi:hypoxanthine phosphoribosyltransferase|nr:hypoxanthine phosphoribosyltransferase [Chitinophagaceae bacterium]
MDIYQVHDKQFKPYITTEEIDACVKRLASEIERDYRDKQPLFIAILSGSFMFASDLFKNISIPAEIVFIKLASYKGTRSTGNVITSIGLDVELHERDVVIIEDIIDTGRTMHAFLPQLQHQQPKSLKICALLHKPESMIYPVNIDYLGFTIPDKFVVGYGLDYDGLGRNLPAIYQLV